MFQITPYHAYTHIQFSHGKGNPIDLSFIHGFFQTLDSLEGTTPVVVIEGIPHFSVGMNLEHLSAMKPAEVETLFGLYEKLLQKLEQSSFIVMAKITGYAMGAGAELALACDFRWMEQKAKIGFPGVNVGFTYNTKRLQRIISKQTAKRLVLTGTTINASQAYSNGIADWVYSSKRMDKEIAEFAGKLAEKSPIALKYAKAAFAELDPERALLLSIQTEHYKEGAIAFLEQRKPSWVKPNINGMSE